MILRKLAFTTMILGSAAALTAACGSDGDDGDGGSKIPMGGAGGAGGRDGGGGNAASSVGGGIFGPGDKDGGGFNPTDKNQDASCGREAIESDTKDVNILVVVDKSASMDVELATNVTRWDVVKLALAASIANTESSVDFGLSLFPYDPANPTGGAVCAMPTTSDPLVPIDPGTPSSGPITDALNGTGPSGGTPTTKALELALDYFTNGGGASLQGDKYVLLATDGGPNCNADHADCSEAECTTNIDGACNANITPNCCTGAVVNCLDDAEAVAAVEALRAAGIDTFVVGMEINQTVYQDTLNALADAGGRAQTGAATRYYSVSDAGGADALTATFESITRELITSCVLELQDVPSDYDPEKVNVDIDGERIFFDENEETASGWHYLRAGDAGVVDYETIVIFGEACAQIEAEGAEAVDVVFGCKTDPIPR